MSFIKASKSRTTPFGRFHAPAWTVSGHTFINFGLGTVAASRSCSTLLIAQAKTEVSVQGSGLRTLA